jgi:dephospho-CoA kinase
MIESGGYRRFDKIIVVWCDSAIQLQRLITRNNLSELEALKRINTQMSQEEKKRYADYTIDTSEGFDAARRQTISVFQQLKLL